MGQCSIETVDDRRASHYVSAGGFDKLRFQHKDDRTMPRQVQTSSTNLHDFPAGLMNWAEALGQALGQGVARGMSGALSGVGATVLGPAASQGLSPRKRGRPAKPFVGFVAADKRCNFAGCQKPARAKGLCSQHYQASRRKKLARA
jgi:hypothetical protein